MKKNGFIATSILYSFFLVFITLFVSLITNYLSNRVLLSAIDEEAKDTLTGINNLKLTDLEIGDSVKFATVNTTNLALNGDATWIVADIVTSGNNKEYTFLSDFNAQEPVVTRKIGTDKIAFRHAVTIDVMNYLSSSTTDGYVNALRLYTQGNMTNMRIMIPKASLLQKVSRSTTIEDIKKEAILGVNGHYAVLIDKTIGGFTYDASTPKYVLYKRYNFKLLQNDTTILSNYCASSFDGSNVTYIGNNSNGFGYTHFVDTAQANVGGAVNYIDFCTYANPGPYNHYATDRIVDRDEINQTDLIKATYLSTTYQYRLQAVMNFSTTDENIYIAGGRGTQIDPYLVTDGGKQA